MTDQLIPPELVAPAFNPATFADRDEVHALFKRLRKDYPLGYEEPQFSFNFDEIQLGKPNPKE